MADGRCCGFISRSQAASETTGPRSQYRHGWYWNVEVPRAGLNDITSSVSQPILFRGHEDILALYCERIKSALMAALRYPTSCGLL